MNFSEFAKEDLQQIQKNLIQEQIQIEAYLRNEKNGVIDLYPGERDLLKDRRQCICDYLTQIKWLLKSQQSQQHFLGNIYPQ